MNFSTRTAIPVTVLRQKLRECNKLSKVTSSLLTQCEIALPDMKDVAEDIAVTVKAGNGSVKLSLLRTLLNESGFKSTSCLVTENRTEAALLILRSFDQQ